MRVVVLCFIVAVGVTLATEQRVQNNEDESSRTKRVMLSGSQTTLIQNGFDAANHLFDKMDKLDFGGVLGDVVGATSSFLGAVGPFVGLFLNLLSGPNAVEQQLKQLYTRVENGFNKIDVQFAQVRRDINFVPAAVQFRTLESSINALQTKLTAISKTTTAAAYRSATAAFVSTHDDGTYAGAGVKLYNAIYHGGLTSGGLFQEFMAKSVNDRGQTQRFMLGNLNLLLRAAALDITYSQLKHSANIRNDISAWVTRITNIKSKMSSLDNSIVRDYHTQMVKDINDFGTLNHKGTLSHTAFADQLYAKLAKKYFWRYIFVLVSEPYDHYKLATHACEYSQQNFHGRTINVASVDKKTPSHVPVSGLFGVKTWMHPVGHGHNLYRCVDSGASYNQLPASKTQCSVVAAAGVVCMQHTDIHIRSVASRYHKINPHGANLAYLFG